MDAHSHGGKIASGEDRFGNPVRFLNGRFDCKVSARDTGGAMCIFDTVRDRCGGPPLHYHKFQDEWFFVMEGEFIFQVGDQRHHVGPGDSVFGPRMVAHAFRNLTEQVRMLLVFQPALNMEAFFRSGIDLADIESEAFLTLNRDHDIEIVGPPLTPDDPMPARRP